MVLNSQAPRLDSPARYTSLNRLRKRKRNRRLMAMLLLLALMVWGVYFIANWFRGGSAEEAQTDSDTVPDSPLVEADQPAAPAVEPQTSSRPPVPAPSPKPSPAKIEKSPPAQ